MIVVTGAAGFIGSCLIERLNQDNFNNIIAVDHFSEARKAANWEGKKITQFVDRLEFFDWLQENYEEVEFIFHLGARTDTAETNTDLLNLLNTEYTQKVWNACCEYQIPLVYASSAATYGNGELGYSDNEAELPKLNPLNPYGRSKHLFDMWALQQTAKPFFWTGLKFFNVYGPNEYHKGRMASVIFHAYQQIKEKGTMALFRSHRPEFADGEQKRDFVYVKDVVDVCYWLMHHRKNSGIYNLGSGTARTFLDLARNTFRAMGKPEHITFKDIPSDIRDSYQYYTQAEMGKLRSIGYTKPFHTLEEGITNYVQNYLMKTN